MTLVTDADKMTVSEKVSFNNTNPLEANFECLHTACYFQATEDCHVAFDRTANVDDFKIKKNEFCHLEKVNFTRISVIGDSTSGILYILASKVSN